MLGHRNLGGLGEGSHPSTRNPCSTLATDLLAVQSKWTLKPLDGGLRVRAAHRGMGAHALEAWPTDIQLVGRLLRCGRPLLASLRLKPKRCGNGPLHLAPVDVLKVVLIHWKLALTHAETSDKGKTVAT